MSEEKKEAVTVQPDDDDDDNPHKDEPRVHKDDNPVKEHQSAVIVNQDSESDVMCTVLPYNHPSCPLDAQVQDMVEVAERVVTVLALHFNDSFEGKINIERAKITVMGLHKVVSFIESAASEQRVSFFEELLSKPLYIEMLGAYVMKHWTDLDNCRVDPFCQQLCHLSSRSLTIASDVSYRVRIRLTELGFVSSLLNSLQDFASLQFSESLQSRVLTSLILLSNCSEPAVQYKEFRNTRKVMKILTPYIKSTDCSIRMMSRSIAFVIGPHLDEVSLELLCLSPKDADELMAALTFAVHHPASPTTIFNVSYSLKELVTEIDHTLNLETNFSLLAERGLINLVSLLLQKRDSAALSAALILAWHLSTHKMARESPLHMKRLKSYSVILENLSKCSNSSVTSIVKCISLSLEPDLYTDYESLLLYCKTSYKFGEFDECKKMAERLATFTKGRNQELFLSSLVYKAKCIYNLYREKLNLYEVLYEQDVKKYNNIMEDVKKVVEILGMALDQGRIDDDGRKYLDIAMMNLIRGSNELHKLKHSRCMLCLKGNRKLQKSHIYPRAGLKTLSENVEKRDGDQLFTFVNAPPKWQYQYSSPKTVTYFMLCSECEHLINIGGEMSFHKHFFVSLYDKENPSSFLEEKQIQYGSWLYHFCMSLIFRGIAAGTGVPEIVNSDEVYDLFKTCRNYLLGLENKKLILPTLHLFVNPAKVPDEYSESILQHALNAPGFFTVQSEDLLEGFSAPPLTAHFAIAHFGVINILCKFSPSSDAILPAEWEINPNYGKYKIPKECARADNIPLGVWRMFQSISRMWHQHVFEALFLKKDRPPNEAQPQPASRQILQASMRECPQLLALGDSYPLSQEYLNSPAVFSVLNMLPEGFHIDFKSGKVFLPSTFVILTHHTYSTNESSGDKIVTVFVGTILDQNTPFIIYSGFVAKGGFCVGFTVKDIDTLTLENLCETEYPDVIKTSSHGAEEFITNFLPQSLRRKGFNNLHSLLHFYGHCSVVPTVDMKCPSTSRCWYCKGLCENCLCDSSFGPGLGTMSVSGIPLTFCSKECADFFIGERKPLKLDIQLFRQLKIDSQKEIDLLQIVGNGILQEDEGVKVFCVIKLGNYSKEYPSGRYIVLCQFRSMFSQRIHEVFVNSKGIPDGILPHASSETETFTEPEMVTKIIRSSLECVHDTIQQQCQTQVPFDLEILTMFQTQLFGKDSSVDSLKAPFQSLQQITTIVQPNDVAQDSSDIKALMGKILNLKSTMTSERRIDSSSVLCIKTMLGSFERAFEMANKDDIFRYLHSCLDFLSFTLQGPLFAPKDIPSINSIGDLLIVMWQSVNTLLSRTETLNTHKTQCAEVVSILLDCIAKSSEREEPSEESETCQITLMKLLFNCCVKNKAFHDLVNPESLSHVLHNLLDKAGREVRFRALLCISYFIEANGPEMLTQQFHLCDDDLKVLKFHVLAKTLSALDGLQFLKRASEIQDNLHVLHQNGISEFVSQFLDDSEEGAYAAEIITALHSIESTELSDESSLSLDNMVERVISTLPAKTAPDVSQLLSSLQSILKILQSDLKKHLWDLPSQKLECLTREMCVFLRLHSEASCIQCHETNEVLQICARLLVHVGRFVPHCRALIVQTGVIHTMLSALDNYKSHSDPSQEIVKNIILYLELTHICSVEARDQYVFENSHEVASILLNYINTPYKIVWLYAKANLIHIGKLLDDRVLEVLALSEMAVKEFSTQLFEALEHPLFLTSLYGGSVTANEILTLFIDATSFEDNCSLIMCEDLLQCFPLLLQNSETEINAAKLLWILIQRDALYQHVKEEAPLLLEIVQEKMNSSKEIFEFLAIRFKGSNIADHSPETLLTYAEGSFSQGMINECLRCCDIVCSGGCVYSEIKEAILILRAKCLFKEYRRLQRLLSMRPVVDASYIALHDSCYKKAHEVIRILSNAFERQSIPTTDSLASTYMDIAMMDVCREGKENLKSIEHCILCQHNHTQLQHSHVIPKAVLQLFQNTFGNTVGKKGYQVINFPKKKQFDYYSAKQLAYYAFCQHCESIFNEEGEKGFLSFIKGLYNVEDVECLVRDHTIQYGTWLYHFAMSLLLRAVVTCTGIPDHMDSTAVYTFFVQCRKFLLGQLSLDSPELPTVFLIFNPTRVPEEYHLDIMNQMMVTPGLFFCDSLSLTDGEFTQPPTAQFMVTHIGTMNFMVIFTENHNDMLSSYRVSPKGGVCIIPPESERSLPKGLWKMFSVQSSEYRQHMEESFFNKQDRVPLSFQEAETEEKTLQQQAFRILQAKHHDVEVFAKQCEDSSSAVLNLLPTGFIIIKESSVVSLPEDHHLMLHYTTCDDIEQTTAFVGICANKKHNARPFVIHYQTKPTTTFCVGFYLQPTGEVDEIMCTTSLDEYPTTCGLVLRVQKSVATSLPVILNSKGFVNLESLIYYFNHSTFECSLDTKCSTPPRCWYCCNRCENCFARALELTKPVVVDNLPLKFCSNECRDLFIGSDKPITVLAVSTRRTSKDTPKIEQGHSEICCIAGEGKLEGVGMRFKVSVRSGYRSKEYPQGRYYCIFNFRTLSTQHCAELFLCRDTTPDSPLPHVQCSEGLKMICRLKDDGILQEFIQAGFRIIKKQHAVNAQNLTQATVSEKISTLPVQGYTQYKMTKSVHGTGGHQPKELDIHGQQCQTLENIWKHFSENDVPTDVSDLQHNHWVKAHEMWRNISTAHNRDVVTLGLLTALIDFLLQVSEGLQMPPYIINFILTLLFKCLQDHDLHEKVDPSFIQSILVPVLKVTDSEGVVLVKMSLATCSSQQAELTVNVEKQDIEVLRGMLKSEETAIEVLSFIEKAVEVDDGSSDMKSSDGMELLSCVLEWCEGNEDQERRAAMLIELLLSAI